MKSLIKKINDLKKSEIKKTINKRMKEFEKLGKQNSNKIFQELCFCFMTANFSAKGGIKIQKAIGKDFLTLNEEKLSTKLKELGHRFPNARAKYVILAQSCKNTIKEKLQSFHDEIKAREWIVQNIKGIGMKEASHFLRNIGYKNVAIIDFHIIDLLAKNNLIAKPKNKSLTSKKYLEIENILQKIAKQTNLTLGELDLYLWYEETGTVLK